MTEKHQLLTDKQFEQKFEDCTLAPALVTYEAHLRLAYIHVKKHGLKNAVVTLYKQLNAFDTKFGNIIIVINKTTIKLFVKLIYDFIKRAKATSFKELLFEFPDIKTHFKSLLVQQPDTSNEINQWHDKNTGFSIL